MKSHSMHSFFAYAKYHYVIVYELNIPQFVLQMMDLWDGVILNKTAMKTLAQALW